MLANVESLPKISFKKKPQKKMSVALIKKKPALKLEKRRYGVIGKNNCPIANPYLLNRVVRYLSPVDVLTLSKTCWMMRKLIREELNHYWHYQVLKRGRELPIEKFIYAEHKSYNWQTREHEYEYESENQPSLTIWSLTREMKVEYGYPTRQRYYYEDETSHFPCHHEYRRIMSEPIPEYILEENQINLVLQVPHGEYVCLKSHDFSEFFDKKGINPWGIDGYGWKPIYYHIGHSVYQQRYQPKVNYFWKYIDYDYDHEKYSAYSKIRRIRGENKRYDTRIEKLQADIDRIKGYQKKNLEEIEFYQGYEKRLKLENPGPSRAMKRYQFFCQEYKKKNPRQIGTGNLTKLMSQAWKKLTEEEKDSYRVKAERYFEECELKRQEYQSRVRI